MKYYLVALIATGVACKPGTGTMNGDQLLNKVLAYHDPHGIWEHLESTVYYHEYRSDSTIRKSVVHFNNISDSFKMERTDDKWVITRGTVSDSCYVLVNGSADFNAELDSIFNLECERSFLYRDYYLYMQGLPMKLKDPGTIIAPEVDKTMFLDKEYYKLKVTYSEEVGSDVWYFYVDPEIYAVQAYQFYHDETKEDGEYILLEGSVENQGMIWPRERIWYTNKDHRYLGKDVIVDVINN